jgi:hypothetical protein
MCELLPKVEDASALPPPKLKVTRISLERRIGKAWSGCAMEKLVVTIEMIPK